MSLYALLVLTSCSAAPADSPASPPSVIEVRQAVGRSLPYLEKEGVAWLDSRKCISCHHGPFMLWSLHEARNHGIAVDEKKLDALTRRVLDMYLKDEKQYQTKKTGYVEATSLIHAHGDPRAWSEATTTSLRPLTALVVNGQQKDGFWKYAGQGQKRPNPESDAVTTRWVQLALATPASTPETTASPRDQAEGWLKKAVAGEGNESFATRLLLEVYHGDAGRVQELAEELVRQQNSDGGWSWAKGQLSDPYATGQSLYTLGRAGWTGDRLAVQKAWKFLLDKQKPDGSWTAFSKKPEVKDKDNGISGYWGTAWAVIGLSATLPSQLPAP